LSIRSLLSNFYKKRDLNPIFCSIFWLKTYFVTIQVAFDSIDFYIKSQISRSEVSGEKIQL